MSYLALTEEHEEHWTHQGQGGPNMQALFGYIGVFQALIYALLAQFHLAELTPVVDAVLHAVSTAAGVGGAIALHQAAPPAKQ